MEETNPSYFGTLTFAEPQTVELAPAADPERKITVTCEHGNWRPPERLRQDLSEDFFVPIDCYTGRDGVRRIVPICNFEELIDVGAVGGLAVAHGVRGLGKELDHSYRAMQLIHQYVRGRKYSRTRGMKEHLTRQFEYSRDLYIRSPGRLSDDERDVLPDDVGLNACGEGQRLSVTRLTELGRRAAQEAGSNNPTSKQAIEFALFEAAKMNPLEVEVERVPALVQMALFDIDATEDAPSEELIEVVTERLLEAIHCHLDDSREEFHQWFHGPSSSVVKQIAQQRSKRGGRLGSEEVRQALLLLGWRAYEYVGEGVHALMRYIKNSMPDPLNDEEKRLFEHMYERQPYYGDLPLPLLAERSSVLKHAVLMIWEEPKNQDHVHVLHRLLAYYAHMARKRREADRRSKQRCQSGPPTSPIGSCTVDQATEEDADRSVEGPNADEDRDISRDNRGSSVQFIDNLHSPRSAEEDAFAEVAEHIRELRGIECGAHCGYWDYRLEGNSDEPFTIVVRCECGRAVGDIRITRQEFARHANDILG